MPLIRPGIFRRFRLGRRAASEIAADVDEELVFHLEERSRQLEAQGFAPHDARAEALRRLGAPLDDVRRRLRHSALDTERHLAMYERLDGLRHDIRHAWRGMRHHLGFTCVAVATLAIGIGANTAVFSAVDTVLLRALPFPYPSRLMSVELSSRVQGPTQWSWPKFEVFREAAQSYSSLALYAREPATFTGTDPERTSVEWVSAAYLRTLGISPGLGRDFPLDQDSGVATPRRAIISAATWQRRFHAAPDVIGKFLSVDGSDYEIIGVLPGAFRGLSGAADALLPITSRDADALGPHSAWSLEFDGVGRLKAGATPAAAAAEAALIGTRVYRAYPMTGGMITTTTNDRWSASSTPLDGQRVDPSVRRALLIVFIAVLLVLLITCVNLANLLIGRASARRQEIAVRLALGAGRGQLIRMLLTESVLLALIGGGASLLLAWAGIHALARINANDALAAQGFATPVGTNGFDAIHLDGRTLVFAFILAIVVGVLFGLIPALQATQPQLAAELKEGSAGSGRGVRANATRRALVIAEVALAIVLLAGAGLTLRSLSNLINVNPGFDGRGTLTLRLAVPPGVTARDSMPGFYDQLRGTLAAIPGVEGVALADCPPLQGGCNGTILTFPDRPASATGNAMIGVHWVSNNWFETMRVPLLRGRRFDANDRLGGPRVVVINRAAAKKYFPGQNPVGRQVAVWQGGFDKGATVVGVVGDVRFATIDSAALPDAYIPYQQSPIGRMMIFVRTRNDPRLVVASVRRALHQIAPYDPVYDLRTMQERVATASAEPRSVAVLLTLFAVVALVLAVIGIYGVMSFNVARRAREIGIRVALGADRARVLGMIIGEGAWLTGAGCVIGLFGALALTRVLRSLLFEITPGDPGTYVTIVAVLAAAAFFATWIPARRAARLDPVRVLGKG